MKDKARSSAGRLLALGLAPAMGLAVAITLAALGEAGRLGYAVGVLGTSEMGYPVYRRPGFGELCRIGIHEWRPSA